MKNIFILTLCGCFLLLSACDEEPTVAERAGRPKQAFDVAGYLDEEVRSLAGQPVTVRKTVLEEGKAKEMKTFRSLNWSNELASFAEIDLNKPALVGLFEQEETTNQAGHTVRRYTAKDGAKTNVKEAVYTFNGQGELLQIDATIWQENMLFETLKQMHLQLQPNAVPRLQRYRLEETQELLFMDAEQYGVEGVVLR